MKPQPTVDGRRWLGVHRKAVKARSAGEDPQITQTTQITVGIDYAGLTEGPHDYSIRAAYQSLSSLDSDRTSLNPRLCFPPARLSVK